MGVRRIVLTVLLVALPALAAAPAEAVVGGTVASRPYPFMTALEIQGSFACGATLVAPQLVLTAAHCVRDDAGATRKPSDFRVLVGAARRSQRATGDDLAVVKVEQHERYGTPAADSNDVALLTLAAPSSRTPVALAGAADRPRWTPGQSVTAIGWGVQVPGDPGLTVADDLREVQLPIVSDASCGSSYGSAFDAATMVCAGEANGGKDTCQGDSGGPLLVGDGAGGVHQVGVVSFGTACGLPGQYGVYARVGEGALRDWIAARLPAAAQVAAPAGGGSAGSGSTTSSTPAATLAGNACLPARAAFSGTGLPGLRLGRKQRGNGSRCVDGGGRVELRTRNGRLALVVTTAKGHRMDGIRVGGRPPKTRTAVAGLRRVGGAFALVRNGKVAALAAADLKARRDLKALARRIRDAAG